MRRLVEKRWLAFVLTLSILFASGAWLPSRSYGDSGTDPIAIGDTSGGGSQTAGDPDGPAGPTKGSPRRSYVRNGSSYAATPAGDGGAALSVWKWRLQVVLQALRIRLSRI